MHCFHLLWETWSNLRFCFGYFMNKNVQLLEFHFNFRSSSRGTFRLLYSQFYASHSYVRCGWLAVADRNILVKKSVLLQNPKKGPSTQRINILQGQIGKSFNWTVWKRHGRWHGMTGILLHVYMRTIEKNATHSISSSFRYEYAQLNIPNGHTFCFLYCFAIKIPGQERSLACGFVCIVNGVFHFCSLNFGQYIWLKDNATYAPTNSLSIAYKYYYTYWWLNLFRDSFFKYCFFSVIRALQTPFSCSGMLLFVHTILITFKRKNGYLEILK